MEVLKAYADAPGEKRRCGEMLGLIGAAEAAARE
jgi:hypothetical protein